MRNKTIFYLISTILLCFSISSYAQKISVKYQNITVMQAIQKLQKQTNYSFIYAVGDIDIQKIVSVDVFDAPLSDAVKQILKGQNVTYKISGNKIIIQKVHKEAKADGPVIHITGIVYDNNGQPLAGATVSQEGTTIGTITDGDGKFSLNVPSNALITTSFVGLKSQRVRLKGQKFITIHFDDQSTKNLGEVVVTALGIKRSEKGLGYAVQKMSGDQVDVVKNVDVASGMVGKVAGLQISSSTEFNEAPTLSLRGETPLLVVDGVPYTNITLRDIAADDIESINVLKGATASALYGSRGGSGAIIVTTKRGNQKGGMQVSVNSSTMFNAGFLTLPKVQTAYSSGSGGKYSTGGYVWGDRLDAGRMAKQYNPQTYQWEEMPLTSKGKNNLQNFMQTGLVTNNNISISNQGKHGSFRTSLTYVYNKGQYPNSTLNKITYTVGGTMKAGNFTFEGDLTYNKRFYPNDGGKGYGRGGYLYNLLVWSGSEYDIRDYRNYWVRGKEDIQQNWMDNQWYDNPYFLANSNTHNDDYDVTNGFMSMKYDFTPWLNVTLRSGLDYYADRQEWKDAMSSIQNKLGYYSDQRQSALSSNTDLLVMGNHKFGKFGLDVLLGGTVYFSQFGNEWGATNNGLSVPGFFSLKSSIGPVNTGQSFSKKQVNSIYGKATLSWESLLFVDITGRNDWSSSLPTQTRSYFYPSVAASLVLSEFLPLPRWIDMLKLRGSWTQTKNDIGVYDTNNTYAITNNLWDGLNGAEYPDIIRNLDLRPESSISYEVGAAANFLKNRLWVDFTYFNKLRYNFAVKAPLSQATGFDNIYVNSQEQRERSGFELSLGGQPVKTKDFKWNSIFNWSLEREIYKKLDPLYSSKDPWIQKGGRTDIALSDHFWDTDSQGNIVNDGSGMPILIEKQKKMGYINPDWIWGWSNTFTYKNFTLDISIDGSVGGMAYNKTEQAMWNSGAHIKSDNKWRYDEVMNHKQNYVGQGVQVVSGRVERDAYGNVIFDNRVFRPNNQQVSYEAYVQRYYENAYTSVPQSFFDRTFIKLRELALSYNIPSALCQRAKLQRCSVSFVGNNLLMWTKAFKYSDPDKGSDDLNAPSMRYMGFDVKFSF